MLNDIMRCDDHFTPPPAPHLSISWSIVTGKPGRSAASGFGVGCGTAGGPYPLLAVSGEQGSAKTVLSKLLKALVDPNMAPVRSLVREERDLVIAANNSHILAFDNRRLIFGASSRLRAPACGHACLESKAAAFASVPSAPSAGRPLPNRSRSEQGGQMSPAIIAWERSNPRPSPQTPLTVQTVLTVSAPVAWILITLPPVRPSRAKAISMPRARRKL
jgi:hypothetical protein